MLSVIAIGFIMWGSVFLFIRYLINSMKREIAKAEQKNNPRLKNHKRSHIEYVIIEEPKTDLAILFDRWKSHNDIDALRSITEIVKSDRLR